MYGDGDWRVKVFIKTVELKISFRYCFLKAAGELLPVSCYCFMTEKVPPVAGSIKLPYIVLPLTFPL